MATRARKPRQPSSKYRTICEHCNGRGYYLPAWATSWDGAEDCATCQGDGELCQSCGKAAPLTDPPTPHPCVGPADPADVTAILGYWANVPRWEVDEVWTRNGNIYCSVSPRFRSAECPPDASIYRYEIRETTRGGDGHNDQCCGEHDVEYIHFEEIGAVNGMTGKTEWYDEDEQAYPDEGR